MQEESSVERCSPGVAVSLPGMRTEPQSFHASAQADSTQALPPAIAWLLRVLGAKAEYIYMRHPNPWVVIIWMTSFMWWMAPSSLLVTGPLAYGYWHTLFLPLHLGSSVVGTLAMLTSLRAAPEDTYTLLRSAAGPMLGLIANAYTVTGIGPLVEAVRLPNSTSVMAQRD